MSLVHFHIFLITVATIFSGILGSWEFGAYANSLKSFDLLGGIASSIATVGLACYLLWFIKKKKPLMK